MQEFGGFRQDAQAPLLLIEFGALEIHLRAALRNGITRAEIKEIFIHVATYCGAPAALDSFRIAKKIFAEQRR